MVHRFMRALCLVLLVPSLALAVATEGRVFRDDNANGKPDPDEAGWPGVAVTDGVAFAVTGPDGHYSLDARVDRLLAPMARPVIGLCWPSDAWPTTPWFRRPDEQGDGTAVDFGLKSSPQLLPFRFVHGTDPHIPRLEAKSFEAFRGELAGLPATQAFCILTGDNVDLSDSRTPEQAAAEFGAFDREMQGFPLPWFTITGNHDVAGVRAKQPWPADNPLLGYRGFTRHMGPLRWSFDYAGVHFVGIDFNTIDQGGKWVWGVPPSAVDWLRNDLDRVRPGRRVFLFVHFIDSPDPGFAELLRGRVTRIFAGHTHTEGNSQWRGTPLTLSGSLSQVYEDKDRQPGYRLVQVTADGVDSFYKTIGQPHAITLDYPRYKDTLKRGEAIRGAFYDPAGAVKTLRVTVGTVAADVPFTRGALACSFEAKLDLGQLPAGVQPVEVTVSDGEKSWSWRHSYQVGG